MIFWAEIFPSAKSWRHLLMRFSMRWMAVRRSFCTTAPVSVYTSTITSSTLDTERRAVLNGTRKGTEIFPSLTPVIFIFFILAFSLLRQLIHGFRQNLRVVHQALKLHIFVRLVLPHLVARENGAEGQGIRHHLGVGAAADAFGARLLPG